MSYKIIVKEYDGNAVFEHDGVMFDYLPAFLEFEDGALSVFRDGAELAKTTSIGQVGTHGASMCFNGLSGQISGQSFYPRGLDPLNLCIGDEVVIDTMPGAIPNEDFAAFLRQRSASYAAQAEAVKSFRERTFSMDEFLESARAGLKSNPSKPMPAVLRLH